MKRPYPLLSAGIILVMLGIFFEVMTDYSSWIILTFINAGTIMIVIAAVHLNTKDKVRTDERTRKAGAIALSWSWLVTFVTLNVIYWLLQLQIVELTGIQTLSILFPVMLLTGSGFQWYLRRRGDVH